MAELLNIFEFALRGLFIGSLYALMASGLSLIFGVMRVINVAHGDFLMLGGYVAFFTWSWTQLNPIATLLVGMPLMFLFGMLIQRLLIERVIGRPQLSSLMLTFGISVVLWNVTQALFSPDPRGIPYLFEPIEIFGKYFAKNSLVIFGTSSAIALLLFLFMRAVSQNYEMAQVCGIDARKIRMLSFGLGSALAAAAGAFVPIHFSLFPGVGQEYILKAFAVVVLGGLGSLPGAFVGGLLLGMVESLITFYLNVHLAYLMFYATIVLVLLVRPGGLFGVGMVEE